MKITAADARAELSRRALPKTDPKYLERGPAWRMSGEELRTLAGVDKTQAQAKAKATIAQTPKAKGPRPTKHGRTKAGTPVSEAAWNYRALLFSRGVKITYAEAVAIVKNNNGLA